MNLLLRPRPPSQFSPQRPGVKEYAPWRKAIRVMLEQEKRLAGYEPLGLDAIGNDLLQIILEQLCLMDSKAPMAAVVCKAFKTAAANAPSMKYTPYVGGLLATEEMQVALQELQDALSGPDAVRLGYNEEEFSDEHFNMLLNYDEKPVWLGDRYLDAFMKSIGIKRADEANVGEKDVFLPTFMFNGFSEKMRVSVLFDQLTRGNGLHIANGGLPPRPCPPR